MYHSSAIWPIYLVSHTYVHFYVHFTREEEVGDGGENQAAGGYKQTHPPSPHPTGITVSQLPFCTWNEKQADSSTKPDRASLNFKLEYKHLIITQTTSVHVHVDLQHDWAQQVANGRSKYRDSKEDGCEQWDRC